MALTTTTYFVTEGDEGLVINTREEMEINFSDLEADGLAQGTFDDYLASWERVEVPDLVPYENHEDYVQGYLEAPKLPPLVTSPSGSVELRGSDVRSATQAAAVLLGVEVLNGYVIIAERRDTLSGYDNGRRVILGAKRALGGFDYVVATAPRAEDRPTGWDNGHYFDQRHDGGRAFECAVRAFDNR